MLIVFIEAHLERSCYLGSLVHTETREVRFNPGSYLFAQNQENIVRKKNKWNCGVFQHLVICLVLISMVEG